MGLNGYKLSAERMFQDVFSIALFYLVMISGCGFVVFHKIVYLLLTSEVRRKHTSFTLKCLNENFSLV